MAVAQRSGRSRYRLALLILTAVTLLTLDFRGFGPLETAQSRVRDLLAPVVSALDTGFSPLENAWTSIFSADDLRRENAELRAALDEFRTADIRVDADNAAYRRLVEATGVTYVGDVDRITATVLSDAVGNFDDAVITIDVGRDDGVVPGMAVVTAAGLVGLVDVVDAGRSTVESVSSPDLVIGVTLLSTGTVGLGHGVVGDPSKFVVEGGLRWPETDGEARLPEVGSAVVTAASSRYPADVPVGRVAAVAPREAGLAQSVTVDLAAQTRDLGFVTVLLQPPSDEPPTAPGAPFLDVSP